MKKNLFMVAAVALMTFTACNKEEINDSVNAQAGTVEFVAGFDVDTKTALDETKTKTLWSDGDKISINGFEFVVSELIEGGVSAKFVNVDDLQDFGAPYTAYYPANVTEIPAEQTAYANTFDPTAVIEKAESDDHNLSFQNVASLLKFQVPSACKKVTITANENLAENSKSVTISGNMISGQDYYVAVLPGVKNCFEVRIDGYLSKAAAFVTIEEATIANMKSLPASTKSTLRIIGDFNSWNTSSTPMYDEGTYFVAKDVSIGTNDFLFYNTSNSAYIKGPTTVTTNTWQYIYGDNTNNIKISSSTSSAKYDIYLDKLVKRFYITPAGSEAPTDKTLYIEISNNTWAGYNVYGWASFADNNYDGIWGSWSMCPSNSTVTKDGKKYLYMRFPSFYNNETISFKLSNTGNNDQQSSEITGIKLTSDLSYKLNNATLSK